ncbi:MAG: adenylate/guanylate cyclase domain-containing protein [Armatimonadetes bacterium]|nr:adenylate/guanylate cyclase domain-containing protein [Armatimonadota bacterium]
MRWAIHARKFILISFLVAVLNFICFNLTPLCWINAKVTDDLLKHFRIKQHESLVLVVIDDESLNRLGRFPFDRKVYAKLLDNLREAGAKVVVFDILFVEPTSSDKIFAEAMKRFGKVVLGINLSQKSNREHKDKKEKLKRFAIALGFPLPLSAFDVILPPEPLLDACFSLGFVYPFPDMDGVCRMMPLAVGLDKPNIALPSLSLAAVMAFSGKPKMYHNSLRWSDRKLSLGEDWDVPVLPPFSIGQIGFKSFSFVKVLESDFEKNFLKDKLVLVGMAASGLSDRLPTSTDPLAYGVEIHASVINSLLTGHSPICLPLWLQFIIILAFSVPLGMSVLLRQFSHIAIAFLSAILLAFLSSLLMLRLGFVMPIVPILLSQIFVIFAAIGLKAEIQWRFLQPYIAKPVAEMLQSVEPEQTRVVERREITVLFSDIRDFTTISASLTPYEVVTLLESYFNHMSEIVRIFGGVIDKFLGDGMMVLFGTSPDQKDHAQRAVLCAFQMLEELSVVNWEWEQVAGLPLKIGIGVNTGIAILGEIGAEWRKDFTAFGLTVNLAQRLEQLTKELGENLLIGEGTYQQVFDLVVAEPIEIATVKGIEQPIIAYKVLGLTEKGKQFRHLILAERA